MPPPSVDGRSNATPVAPAHLAKAALRRLAAERAEPTPDNFARAYAIEQGGVPEPVPVAPPADARPSDSGEPWAALIDRLVRGLERGDRQWTSARKKESLQRVLAGSRADARRLLQRLDQLVGSWSSDGASASEFGALATMDGDASTAGAGAFASPEAGGGLVVEGDDAASTSLDAPETADRLALAAASDAAAALVDTVQAALAPAEPGGATLGAAIATAVRPLPSDEAAVASLQSLCRQARLTIEHRHDSFAAMGALCRELTASLCDLAEDDSWARGQCAAMQTRLDEGLTPRGVRSVGELLNDTRTRQAALQAQRGEARDALKAVVNRLFVELAELGTQTGRFQESVGRHATVIERADSVEGLTVAVRALVDESRDVQSLVGAARQRLHDERERAQGLAARVETLEAELRRLSDEVVTDQLTQVANRRGLALAFGKLTQPPQATPASEGAAGPLCVGLLDIDNFKRLNDQLGHTAGDEALKALAAAVAAALRPVDVVARYGGEEFVVLLPATDLVAGQTILTRMQRSLSSGLFLHDGKPVFVTFSAGVTLHVDDEPIEQALERADRALYDAKRSGKNRTCVG